MSSGNGYKVIGTRPIRHDGVDKVTGRAVYGGDTRLPGLLYGQVLRSPHAPARIKSIDTSRAAALPGVKAIITGKDFPDAGDQIVDLGEGPARLKYIRDNVLATDKALYSGHPVAAVCATSLHIAEEALDLIEIEYEVLDAVLDVREAMQEGAPQLHDDMTTQEFGEDTGKKSNLATHFQHKLGDPDKAFAAADVVIEREFHTATVHQGYIEPHNATAMWNSDGQITVWTSTQGSFAARAQTGAVLDVPASSIKVVPQEIGGGFGGKIPIYLEPVAALLSKLSGQPVKLIMTRPSVFESTGPTPGSYVKIKMGATKDGKITAADAYIAFESGAYPGGLVGAAAMCVFSCYDIADGLIDCYDVVCNKPRSFAYRAPGSTQVAFATEHVVDLLAAELGIDPLEFRLKNTATTGTRRIDGVVYPKMGCKEVLEAIRDSDHYKSAAPSAPNQGRGISVGYWFNVGLKSACTASVNNDGTVSLSEGSTDIGGSRTSIAMQFAETMGIGAEDVKPQVVDTDSIGHTDVTGGSRVTYATGWAAYKAALDIQDQLCERAAQLWEVEADQVKYEDGTLSAGDRSTSFKELAGELDETGGPVVGRASVNPDSGVGGSFAANIADVEVDPETGKVQVLRFTVIQDAGTAIHPSYVEGQMQGGSVQGIGWALNEEYFYSDNGHLDNSSYLDYRIPTTLDLPMIETIIVEVPNPGHPYGVRGVGEANIAPPPAALANAIDNAVGVRPQELPMKPDRIVSALQSEGQSAPAAGG
ncbi:MAG: xanthine dehydrogenase family protein molybdopterin-binding subunit [Candidatus Latescibacteria bacterium]|nr:xanthine dehydrogenase family protein molybdopterin-binding subunit [Candidatus Latescibacterota bacterium]